MGASFGKIIGSDPIMLIAVIAALAVFAWAFMAVRRMARGETSARRRLADLEVRLNEAESAIAAEAHMLVIWRGRADRPDRVIGSMHGAAEIPTEVDELLNFPVWLEHDSADALSEAVQVLRGAGTAFNIGVRTKSNELLEADGRTAGGLATLRFRPSPPSSQSDSYLQPETD